MTDKLKTPIDGIVFTSKEVALMVCKKMGELILEDDLPVGENYYLIADDKARAIIKINSKKSSKVSNLYKYSVEQVFDTPLKVKDYSKPSANLIQICKVNEEKQIVTGAVLIPDKEDLQGDTISADEIENAMINFMLNDGKIGFMHKTIDDKETRFKLVECFCAPQDLTYGNKPVSKGSWIVSVKCMNQGDWQKVKSGQVKGFSIGGWGKEAT